MGFEWVKAKTKEGKTAIKAALIAECYDNSINYDALTQLFNISPDISPYELKETIKDLQQKYLKQSEPDQQQKPKKETRGRKNRGLTEKHYQEKKEYYKTLYNEKTLDNFNSEIIECVDGEIINDSDMDQFNELYMATCQYVLDKFKEDNPELTKKYAYAWYKNLLIELKKNVPGVTINDIDKLFIIWDCLTWLMNSIGLYITAETYYLFTGTYKKQYEQRAELNQKYSDFLQKITYERDQALLNELNYSPFNSTNKIFIAKVLGFVEKTEPKQIEIHHDIRNYDTLPMMDTKKEQK